MGTIGNTNKRLTFEERVEALKLISPEITLVDEFKSEKDGKFWCHYLCSCGNKEIETRSWNDLQNGKRQCPKCKSSKVLTFSERVEILKERNPEVILLTAERDDVKSRYMCTYKTTFNDTIKTREWTNLISPYKIIKQNKK